MKNSDTYQGSIVKTNDDSEQLFTAFSGGALYFALVTLKMTNFHPLAFPLSKTDHDGLEMTDTDCKKITFTGGVLDSFVSSFLSER